MRKTIEERFLTKINILGLCLCWEWTGIKNKKGYGRFCFKGKTQLSHRVSWQMFFNEIPNNLCVLHKCDNPGCVNPLHLKLGTHKENTKDMLQKGRNNNQNKKKTHCKRNHPLSGVNLYMRTNGSRACKICGKTRWRTYYRSRK